MQGADSPPCALFVRAAASFAAASRSPVEHDLRLAGATLRLRFAHADLVPFFLPALAHLEDAETRGEHADFTIDIWDQASTGATLPPLPWTRADELPQGRVRGFDDARIRTLFMRDPARVTLYDAIERRALFFLPDARELPSWELAGPLRPILQWWADSRGLHMVHGAGIGRADGGVLMVGRGGSGKSTSALACLRSDRGASRASPVVAHSSTSLPRADSRAASLGFAGDDYVLASSAPSPRIHSVYASAKLFPADLTRFPELADAPHAVGEKLAFFLARDFADKIVRDFPLRAILLPRVVTSAGLGGARIVACGAAEALRALAPTTIFQLPGTGRESMDFMTKLVSAVPCWRLEVGADLDAIPRAIEELLA